MLRSGVDFDSIYVGVNKIDLLSWVVNYLVKIVWEKEKDEDLEVSISSFFG